MPTTCDYPVPAHAYDVGRCGRPATHVTRKLHLCDEHYAAVVKVYPEAAALKLLKPPRPAGRPPSRAAALRLALSAMRAYRRRNLEFEASAFERGLAGNLQEFESAFKLRQKFKRAEAILRAMLKERGK